MKYLILDNFRDYLKQNDSSISEKFISNECLRGGQQDNMFTMIVFPKGLLISLPDLNNLQTHWKNFVQGFDPNYEVHPLLVDGKEEPLITIRSEMIDRS